MPARAETITDNSPQASQEHSQSERQGASQESLINVAEEAAEPDSVRYTLTITARPKLRTLLQRYLELAKRNKESDLDADGLAILVDRSQRQAKSLLATEGYFSPQIDVTVDMKSTPWAVHLTVDEGEAVHVSAYQLSFVGPTKALAEQAYAQRQLADRATLRVGDIFRQAPWDVTKNGLLSDYLTDTFPAARFTYTLAKIDPEEHTAVLELEIDAGPPYSFGASRIEGLSTFSPQLITQISQFNLIAPGQPWQQSRLLDLQSALQALPYFRSVIVTSDVKPDLQSNGQSNASSGGEPATPPATPQQVPVEIRVTEAQTHRVELGGGFSSNTGLRVQAAYSDINLRGRGWIFDNRIKVEQLEQSTEQSLRFPVRHDGWVDSVSLNLKHSDVEGLQVSSAVLEGKRSRKEATIDRAFSLGYAYSIEDIDRGTTNRVYALYPGWSFTKRALDSGTFPRQGYVANVQLAFGAAPLLSSATFFRVYAKTIGVIPIGSTDSLALRVEGGAVFTDDVTRVPNDLRFRAGGDQSLRGYRYQAVGIASGAAIVGGRYLGIAGAEYSHWFNKTWGLGVFAESGDVTNRIDEFKPNTGVGLGPRWRSPVGPINVDIAYGLQSREVRLHFSLGFVF